MSVSKTGCLKEYVLWHLNRYVIYLHFHSHCLWMGNIIPIVLNVYFTSFPDSSFSDVICTRLFDQS